MNLVINDFVGDAAFTGFDEALPLRKGFQWKTDRVAFDSGIEQRNQILEQPIRHWSVNWELLDQAARDKVIELFQRARGRFETFLYTDSDDFQVELTESIVTAAGGETTTQLIKNYYVGETETWVENKKDIVPSGTFPPVIKIDAAVKTEGTHFTLSDMTGIIDWTGGSAPNGALGAGEVVTAQYRFYFRVRFDFDLHIDEQIHATPLFNNNLRLIEVLS